MLFHTQVFLLLCLCSVIQCPQQCVVHPVASFICAQISEILFRSNISAVASNVVSITLPRVLWIPQHCLNLVSCLTEVLHSCSSPKLHEKTWLSVHSSDYRLSFLLLLSVHSSDYRLSFLLLLSVHSSDYRLSFLLLLSAHSSDYRLWFLLLLSGWTPKEGQNSYEDFLLL